MLKGKHFSRSPPACLNFIKYQEYPILRTNLSNFLEIAWAGNQNSSFPLNSFNEKCYRIRGYRLFQPVNIIVCDFLETSRKRAKIPIRIFIGGESNNRCRASVEIILTDYYFGFVWLHFLSLVSPSPCYLDSCLYGLCTSIHGQSNFHSCEFAELFQKGSQAVVIECPAG